MITKVLQVFFIFPDAAFNIVGFVGTVGVVGNVGWSRNKCQTSINVNDYKSSSSFFIFPDTTFNIVGFVVTVGVVGNVGWSDQLDPETSV